MQMKKAILRNSEIVFFFDKKIILWPTRRVFFPTRYMKQIFLKSLQKSIRMKNLANYT